jgi:hypothetical protein
MIFVIPLVLVAAILALRGAKRDFQVAGAQGRWFLAWSAAGAATTFSVLTGLSVGVFVLPFAALLLSWVARRSRHLLDATGFVAGIGVALVLVAFLNRSGSGLDPMPWLVAGVCLDGSALLAYALLGRSRPV